MSNGDPEPSRTTYIIVCNGQTALLTTDNWKEQIRIAARTATDMVMYLGIVANSELTVADTEPISDCLHWFEKALKNHSNLNQVPAKITELMSLVEGLHKKFADY